MCRHIFLWHFNDIFHATSACRGNGCLHGLFRGVIFLKEPCICKMRLNPSEWLNTTIYLPFPASIVVQTLMKSGSDSPMFIEPWSPKQQLIRSLSINYIFTRKMEDVARSLITNLTRIISMARWPSRLNPGIIVQLFKSSSIMIPSPCIVDFGMILTANPLSTRMRSTFYSLMKPVTN